MPGVPRTKKGPNKNSGLRNPKPRSGNLSNGNFLLLFAIGTPVFSQWSIVELHPGISQQRVHRWCSMED